MTKDDGGSAFPCAALSSDGRDVVVAGMSLRDYAVIKFVAANIVFEGMEGTNAEDVIAMAHAYANFILAERSKRND